MAQDPQAALGETPRARSLRNRLHDLLRQCPRGKQFHLEPPREMRVNDVLDAGAQEFVAAVLHSHPEGRIAKHKAARLFHAIDNAESGKYSMLPHGRARTSWALEQGTSLHLHTSLIRAAWRQAPKQSRNATIQNLKDLCQPSPSALNRDVELLAQVTSDSSATDNDMEVESDSVDHHNEDGPPSPQASIQDKDAQEGSEDADCASPAQAACARSECQEPSMGCDEQAQSDMSEEDMDHMWNMFTAMNGEESLGLDAKPKPDPAASDDSSDDLEELWNLWVAQQPPEATQSPVSQGVEARQTTTQTLVSQDVEARQTPTQTAVSQDEEARQTPVSPDGAAQPEAVVPPDPPQERRSVPEEREKPRVMLIPKKTWDGLPDSPRLVLPQKRARPSLHKNARLCLKYQPNGPAIWATVSRHQPHSQDCGEDGDPCATLHLTLESGMDEVASPATDRTSGAKRKWVGEGATPATAPQVARTVQNYEVVIDMLPDELKPREPLPPGRKSYTHSYGRFGVQVLLDKAALFVRQPWHGSSQNLHVGFGPRVGTTPTDAWAHVKAELDKAELAA